MATQVRIEIEPIKDLTHAVQITLVGQIDESNLSNLKEYLEPLLKEGEVKFFIFNFRGLEFINSRVIGFFLSLYSALTDEGKTMAIIQSNENIFTILSLVGLTTLIGHYDTLDEALEVLDIQS